MSVTSAMFTGVSGLLNMAEGINVIGNNISNVNTIGYKGARTLFGDTLSAQIAGGDQVGRGVQIQKVENLFSQGVTQGTEKSTDIALQGNGFFALGKPNGNTQITAQSSAYLTRAGAFSVDSNRYLVNPDGFQVLDTQGNPIRFSDNVTAINTAVTTFNTGGTTAAAIAAMQADLVDINALITAMPAGAAKLAAQTLSASTATALTNADTANTNFSAAPTALLADTAATATNAAIYAYQAVASAAGYTIPAGTSTANTAFTTGYAALATEEGKAFSSVSSIDPSGVITYTGKDGNVFLYDTNSTVGVTPTDSNRLIVDRVAIIKVNDPSALSNAGGTLYSSTLAAGIPSATFSKSANGANATTDKVVGNSLEQSNVDMATEFVKMILTQRAYSANSKTITTADEMTQEVLNLKR